MKQLRLAYPDLIIRYVLKIEEWIALCGKKNTQLEMATIEEDQASRIRAMGNK